MSLLYHKVDPFVQNVVHVIMLAHAGIRLKNVYWHNYIITTIYKSVYSNYAGKLYTTVTNISPWDAESDSVFKLHKTLK